MGKMDLKFETGNVNVKLAKGIAFIHVLYLLCSGNIKNLIKKGFKGNVFLGDADMSDKKNALKFTYICHPDNLPGDIKTIDLVKFYSRWNRQTGEYVKKALNNDKIKDFLDQPLGKLDKEQKYELVLFLLDIFRGAVYLIDNITADIPLDDVVRFTTRLDELASNGATVVYVTTPRLVVFKTIEMQNYFDDGVSWEYSVKSHEEGLRIQGKKLDKERDR